MAVLALAAVGAGAGAWATATFGLGTFLGVSAAGWGFSIGGAIGSALFAPRINQEGPRLQNIRYSQSTYGATIPIVLGAFRVSGNVIWLGEIVETASRQRIGKRAHTTTYSYSQSFAVLLSRGPVQGVRRIWFDNRLVYSGAAADVVTELERGNLLDQMTIYLGDEDQLPDPTMEAVFGVGEVPAYRGTCYLVFDGLALGQWGNRVPSITAEVIENATYDVPTLLDGGATDSLFGAGYLSDGKDTYTTLQWPVNGPNDMVSVASSVYSFSNGERLSQALYNRIPCELKVGAGAIERHPNCWNILDTLRTNHSAGCINEPRLGFNVIGDVVTIGAPPANACWMIADPGLSEAEDIDLYGMPFGPYPKKQRLLNPNEPSDPLQTVGMSGLIRVGNAVYGCYSDTFTGDVFIRRYPCNDNGANGGLQIASWHDASFDLTTIDTVTGAAWIVHDNGLLYFRAAFTTKERNLYVLDLDLNYVGMVDTWDDLPQLNHLVFGIYDGQILYPNFASGVAYELTQASFDLGTETATTLGKAETDDSEAAYLRLFPAGPGLYATRLGTWSMLPQLTGSGRTLAQAITAIAAEAGVDASLLDVTAVTGITVPGYLIERRMSARAAIEPLLAAYGVDAVESAGKIKFVLRGGASVATIAYADLGAQRDAGDSDSAQIASTRVSQIELPQVVDLNYADADADYEIGTQRATRGTTIGDQAVTVEFAIAESHQVMARAANRLLYEGWAQRTSRKIATTMRYAAIEPSDVVLLEDAAGDAGRVRVTGKIEDDGLLQFDVVDDDDGTYSQIAAGASLPPRASIPPPLPISVGAYFEVPPLSDGYANGVWLLAAARSSNDSAWPGASIWRASEGGADFSEIGTLSASTLAGIAEEELPAFQLEHPAHDPGTLVIVSHNGTPPNISDGDYDSGHGVVLIGRELIRYRTATSLGSNRYRLSGLARGLYGTDYAGHQHYAGEQVIFLGDGASLLPVRLPLDDIGRVIDLRAVTIGRNVADALPVRYQITGISARPLAPVHLAIGREVTGDIKLIWSMRSRSRQVWRDLVGQASSEAPDGGYAVEWIDADTDEVIRSATIDADTFTDALPAATWLAHYGDNIPDEIRVRVAQISPFVGPGRYADQLFGFPSRFFNVFAMDWSDASTANQTLYGTATPSHTVSTGRYNLTNASAADVKSKFDSGPTCKDCIINCDITVPSAASSSAGIVFRTTYWRNADVGFGWLAYISNAGTVGLGYGDNANNNNFTLVGSSAVGHVSGTVVATKIEAIGSLIRVYTDGVLRVEVTDTTHEISGAIGLRSYAAATLTAVFDNLRVEY